MLFEASSHVLCFLSLSADKNIVCFYDESGCFRNSSFFLGCADNRKGLIFSSQRSFLKAGAKARSPPGRFVLRLVRLVRLVRRGENLEMNEKLKFCSEFLSNLQGLISSSVFLFSLHLKLQEPESETMGVLPSPRDLKSNCGPVLLLSSSTEDPS